ncbi:MAG: hypothetical protein JO224_07540 [Pelomonas sp.]|nr:hypothetical protein [Roseateles sp.]
MNDDFFTLPDFKPEQALLNLKRGLRDLRSLQERGDSFELQGQPVLQLSVDAKLLHAKLARKPARSPEWDRKTCKNSADVRALQDEIKRRLLRWTDETP